VIDMQTKKIPMRMCIGCGEMKPKRELTRIVKNKDGEIFLDLKGKAAGRGAYVCKDVECLKKARRQKRLEKAFSRAISEEIYEQLQEEMREAD
jgi:predicted RNA-binding protein YlxR (DUF448 family)